MSTKIRKKREPGRGSLAWYKKQWDLALQANSEGNRALLAKAMAQTSYEKQTLHERCSALEEAFCEMEERFYRALHTFAVGLNQIADAESGVARSAKKNDGMVKIDAVDHLRECLKVLVPGSDLCTCGSQPKSAAACRKPN